LTDFDAQLEREIEGMESEFDSRSASLVQAILDFGKDLYEIPRPFLALLARLPGPKTDPEQFELRTLCQPYQPEAEPGWSFERWRRHKLACAASASPRRR
jgi:hypothetical protein